LFSAVSFHLLLRALERGSTIYDAAYGCKSLIPCVISVVSDNFQEFGVTFGFFEAKKRTLYGVNMDYNWQRGVLNVASVSKVTLA
jgi:hypothetical protein